MSTMVQGIEKEFLLKSLYNEQVSVICMYNRVEYTLKIEKVTKAEIVFKANQVIMGLTSGKKIDLTADYKGVMVVFVVEINSINKDRFIAAFPELLYKNLDRAYPRVLFPPDMQFKFSFLQERYLFPVSEDVDPRTLTGDDLLPDPDLKDFNDIVANMDSWVKESGSEYKLVLFKDVKRLSLLEEQIVIKTGKALFLPSSQGSFLETDPDPKKRVITIPQFLQYLETIGVLPSYFDAALDQFIKSKQAKQILADAWVPLRFKEYVIGYIHFWATKEGSPPLEYTVIKTLYQYANSMIFALKEKEYFESFNLKDRLIPAQGVDISAGGICFSCTQTNLVALLILDSELSIKLITSKRTISLKARVLRRYEEKGSTHFGCHFFDAAPEDVRFLYEYIYGKPFTDSVTASKK
ncbi:MAG: PilZ domain-containing protein [Treponema sp.]|jgi:hypothetical protein|nr:PilZ domain-containing protein [Treponema sp.]